MPMERLQKILAKAGVASRRAAEELILAGRVSVDGRVVNQLGAQADPAVQAIAVDGKPIGRAQSKEYWMAHKPAGYVSTVSDPEGRPRVLDLLPPEADARLYPVGRLDLDSEGLIILTNDGELAQRLTHPRYEVPKIYRVWLTGVPSIEQVTAIRRGVLIDGEQYAPAQVTIKSAHQGRAKVHMELREGRKREIRRIWQALGLGVSRLVRVGIGPLRLGDLPSGAVRRLRPEEITGLKRASGALSGCKGGPDGVKKSPRRGKSPKR